MALDSLFAPHRIVVVGLDDRPPTAGRRLASRLVAGGFAGDLVLVGPRGGHCAGRPTTPASDAPPGPVDLVVIAGDPRDAVGAATLWLARGARALFVASDPRADLDHDDPEGALVALCADAGARLVGPRARGVCAPGRHLALFADDAPVAPGPLALATTAGGDAFAATLGALHAVGLGVHEALQLGAAVDVTLPELLARWHAAPEVQIVALDGLACGHPAALVNAVRALTRDKPLVACGPDAEALAQAGALPAPSRAALAALCAQLTALAVPDPTSGAPSWPRLAGDRVAVAVIGLDGALAAAAAAELLARGFSVPPLAPSTRAHLASELHLRAELDNPLDLLAIATPRHVAEAARAAAADPGIDAVVVALDRPLPGLALPSRLEGKPIVVAAPEDAARALEAVRRLAAAAVAPAPGPTPLPPGLQPQLAQAVLVGVHLTRRTVVAAEEVRRVLLAYGVGTAPTLAVASPHAARRAAADLGFPVALTLHADERSRRVAGLVDGDAVEAAVLRLYAEAGSQDPRLAFDLQPCPDEVDVALDVSVHPRLGHQLSVRHGCRLATSWLPLTAEGAQTLSDAALDALSPELRAAVADLLIRLARLVTDLPELGHAHLGPLGRLRGRWVALDARLTLDALSLPRG